METSSCALHHSHRLIEEMVGEGVSYIEIYIALFAASHAIGSLIFADKCEEIMKRQLKELCEK